MPYMGSQGAQIFFLKKSTWEHVDFFYKPDGITIYAQKTETEKEEKMTGSFLPTTV